MRGEALVSGAVLAALYLRGAPHVQPRSRRRWPLVHGALSARPCALGGVSAGLRAAGLYEEAWVLEQPGSLSWGLGVVERGDCLTVASGCFPSRWESVLGSASPPCFWARGAWPSALAVGVAGSRSASGRVAAFARGLGEQVMAGGRSLVSGGAVGVDSLAVDGALAAGGAGRVVELLPFGLDSAPPREGVCQASLCAPGAGFSSGHAMERNLLIYASSPVSVVVAPRLRAGGSWAGAVECLRRRASRLLVAPGVGADARSAGSALVAMGAARLSSPPELSEWLRADEPPRDLFGWFGVTEPRRLYAQLACSA